MKRYVKIDRLPKDAVSEIWNGWTSSAEIDMCRSMTVVDTYADGGPFDEWVLAELERNPALRLKAEISGAI